MSFVNYVGRLQEFCQKRGSTLPEYGPHHTKSGSLLNATEFEIEVKVSGFGSCTGRSRTKKDAKQNAALNMMDIIESSSPRKVVKMSVQDHQSVSWKPFSTKELVGSVNMSPFGTSSPEHYSPSRASFAPKVSSLDARYESERTENCDLIDFASALKSGSKNFRNEERKNPDSSDSSCEEADGNLLLKDSGYVRCKESDEESDDDVDVDMLVDDLSQTGLFSPTSPNIKSSLSLFNSTPSSLSDCHVDVEELDAGYESYDKRFRDDQDINDTNVPDECARLKIWSRKAGFKITGRRLNFHSPLKMIYLKLPLSPVPIVAHGEGFTYDDAMEDAAKNALIHARLLKII